MEFGYSSSASNSPDDQAFVLPHIYDAGTDSSTSTPTSPEVGLYGTLQSPRLTDQRKQELQQMLAYNNMASYDMLQYPTTPSVFFTSGGNNFPVEFTDESTMDDQDRRKRSTGNSAKDKGHVPNMHLRRRAQNRASQRAFRERKEKHVKGLEHQLNGLRDKHHDLLACYNKQADEVDKLNARIHELTSELEMLRSSNEASMGEMLMPDKFDVVPYPGTNVYFDKGALDTDPKNSQNDDLL